MLLSCPFYAPLRITFADLFSEPKPCHCFLRQKLCRFATFAAACHQRCQSATAVLLPSSHCVKQLQCLCLITITKGDCRVQNGG